MKGLVVKVIREDNDIYDVGESYGRKRWIVLLGQKRYWSDGTIGIVEEGALCIGHGSVGSVLKTAAIVSLMPAR